MNSNRSSLDPRVPSVQTDVRTIFDILANLQLGVGDTTNQFPVTVEYEIFNEDQDEWTTATKILSNIGSAYTFFTDVLPKLTNAAKGLYAWTQGIGTIRGARNYSTLVETFDNVQEEFGKFTDDVDKIKDATGFTKDPVTNKAKLAKVDDIKTTADGAKSQVTKVSDELGFDPNKPAGKQLSKWQSVADQSASEAIEFGYDNVSKTFSVKTQLLRDVGAANDLAQGASNLATVTSGGLTTLGATVGTLGSTLGTLGTTVGSNTAAIAAIYVLLALLGLTTTDSNGNPQPNPNNQPIDLSGLNNSVAALQASDGKQQSFLNAIVNAGYATLSGSTYILTPGFLNLLPNQNMLLQWMVDGGFVTASTTTTNGVTTTTYTKKSSFDNIYTGIVRCMNNDNTVTTALNTFGLLTRNAVTGNTSSLTFPNLKYLDLVNYLVSSNVLISTTANNVTTYTPNTTLGSLPPQLQQTLLNVGFYTSTTDANNVTTYAPTASLRNLVNDTASLKNTLSNGGILQTGSYVQTTNYTSLYTDYGNIPDLIRSLKVTQDALKLLYPLSTNGVPTPPMAGNVFAMYYPSSTSLYNSNVGAGAAPWIPSFGYGGNPFDVPGGSYPIMRASTLPRGAAFELDTTNAGLLYLNGMNGYAGFPTSGDIGSGRRSHLAQGSIFVLAKPNTNWTDAAFGTQAGTECVFGSWGDGDFIGMSFDKNIGTYSSGGGGRVVASVQSQGFGFQLARYQVPAGQWYLFGMSWGPNYSTLQNYQFGTANASGYTLTNGGVAGAYGSTNQYSLFINKRNVGSTTCTTVPNRFPGLGCQGWNIQSNATGVDNNKMFTFKGNIALCMIYDKQVSSSEVGLVVDYVNSSFGLGLS